MRSRSGRERRREQEKEREEGRAVREEKKRLGKMMMRGEVAKKEEGERRRGRVHALSQNSALIFPYILGI
jgi:hypothetical protein